MASILTKILKVALLLLLLMIIVVFGYLKYTGGWNALFPSSDHDTAAPVLPIDLGSPAILVFSKTNGFRHEEGIKGGSRALAEMAAANKWGVYTTENGAVFDDAGLQRFDAVVFLNASGDMLSFPQEQAFQRWMEGGGGWLGIHAAGDGSHAGWQWYMDNLIGAAFTAHPMNPQFQRAAVVAESPDHPVMRELPARWDHVEEWYSWSSSPRERGFTILATVNEHSYSPIQKFMGQEKDLRMGDHPVVWSNCVERGRSVYVAMGHQAEAFENEELRRLLENALTWLMDRDPGSTECSLD